MSPLYAILIAILWSFSSILITLIDPNIHPFIIWIYVQLTSFIISIIIVVFVVIVKHPKVSFQLPKLAYKDVSCILLSTLIGPILAYAFFIYLLKNCQNTSMVVSLAYTVPLFSVIFGYLFLNEKINTYTVIGAFLITIGIFFIVK
jgi:drug/metabolite transporter (DMT)-like permease